MSTWNHIAPSYKGEAVSVLAAQVDYKRLSKVRGIWDYTIRADPAMFPDVPSGNRAELIEKGVDVSCDGEFTDMPDPQTLKLLSRAFSWAVGTKAVYTLLFTVLDGKFGEPLPADVQPDYKALVARIAKVMVYGSALSATDAAAAENKMHDPLRTAEVYSKYEAMLIHLAQAHKIHSYARHEREIKGGENKRVGDDKRRVTMATPVEEIAALEMDTNWFAKGCKHLVSRYKGMYYLVDEEKRGLLMTHKDLSRVILMVRTIRNARVAGEYLLQVRKRGGGLSGINYLMKLAATHLEHGNDLDSLCEAWEASRKYMIARSAGPLCRASAAQMKEDISHLFRLVDPDKITRQYEFSSFQDFTEFMSVNRVLCSPDYDVPGLFSKEKVYHLGKNKVGAEISKEAEDVYQGFLTYNRWAFIRQYQKAFHRNPGRVKDEAKDEKWARNYDGVGLVKVSKANCDKVDLTGCLKYKDRNSDYFMYFEDTAMVPRGYNVNSKRKTPAETNQIVHLLKATEKIDLVKEKEDLCKSVDEHPVTVGYKNEAAKAEGRLYFIFPLVEKILLAEEEENISEFLKHVPGNAVGIDESELRLKMTRIWSTTGITSRVFLSDDISKWSPHMPVRVQEDSDKFWAEVFDQPHLAHMQKIHNNDRVCLNVLHWRASYKSYGANKEGTTGKRMSYLMTNLKAYAVSLARRDGTIQGQVDLLTFLDDGLTAFDVKMGNAEYDAYRAIERLRDIQLLCGYELKIYKSYPSDRYVVFLNIGYYKGAKVYDLMKSFIKRGILKLGVIESLPERLREHSAWASGGVKSGAEHYFHYYAYIEDCVGTVWRWVKHRLVDSWVTAMQFVAPVSHQGYGLSTFLGIVSNLVKHSGTEAFTAMWQAANVLPLLRPIYIRIMNLPVREKTGGSFIRAPGTITAAGVHLQEMRVMRRLETFVLNSEPGVYMAPIVAFYTDDGINEIGQVVMEDNKRIADFVLDRMYKALPEAFVAKILGKFRKCKSVADLIGEKQLNRILSANRKEAEIVASAWILM